VKVETAREQQTNSQCWKDIYGIRPYSNNAGAGEPSAARSTASSRD
jgi:hypothetical protein